MKTLSRVLQSSLFSIILAVLILAAGYFSLEECGRHLSLTEKMENQNIRLKLAQDQLKQSNRTQKIVERVQRFLTQARSLGLTEKKWATYNVSVEEPVTFDEFQEILEQCRHTALFYFNPVSLQVSRTADTENNETKSPRASGPVPSAEKKNGDLYINLKGAFIIRETP